MPAGADETILMNAGQYLRRINYSGTTEPTAETLRALQQAHLLSVPFENLSIHMDEPIIIDQWLLFDKVVNRKRGGFCYELNGLFSWLLGELGFEVVKLSASVARSEDAYTPYFDHLTLMVSLPERWLVEVGFGETFRHPLLIDSNEIDVQPNASFRIEAREDAHYLMTQRPGQEWQPQFRFGLEAYNFDSFEERCHFQQYSPESNFRKGRVCSLLLPDGRITLSEEGLTRTWLDGRRENQPLESEAQFTGHLLTHFGMTL
jgi:N-hydroxyarylamine O-acetyltransferase